MIDRRALLGAAGAAATLAPAAARAQLAQIALMTKLDDTVAPAHERAVLLRWGDRIAYDAPPWDPPNPSVEAAQTQFGWDARIVALIRPPPATDGVPRVVLAIAHPRLDPAMAFPDGRDRPDIAAAMQGATLVNLMRQGGRWLVVDGGFQNRRITARGTLSRLTGPAAASIGGTASGLVGVTGGCATPWGTLLLTEDDPAPWARRIPGLDPARFGWVAELDPLEPQSLPAKRTALGRFAHGDAAAALSADGRAVIYLTDRRVGGFLFRFLSDGAATEPDALDRGTLAVARFDGGDAMRWLALPGGAEQAAREPVALAAQLGATPLEIPSGLAVDPRRARLFLASRGTPPGSSGGSAGSVIEIIPAAGDHGAETAVVQTLVVGVEPPPPSPDRRPSGRGEGVPPPPLARPAMPDTLAVDPDGTRLWIGTNHGGVVGPVPDALYACALDGPGRGRPLPLYGAPRAAAIGGAAVSPEGEAVFTVARRPGAEPGASFARPGTRWPAFDPREPPRTALMVLTRRGGGLIGT